MGDRVFIGIDSGTQGVKVLALSEKTGDILAEASAAHDLIETAEGRREQEARWWISALETALDQVLRSPAVDAGLVSAIGVSGQQHGMTPLDAQGEVIRPAKLWCDTETAAQCEEMTEALGGVDAVVGMTGNSIAAGFTASKILWLKQNEPEHYDRLATVLLPHDYINYWLTGERKTEYGDASGTAYFDVRARAWRPEVLSAIDPSGKLLDCLPELIESDQPVGVLRPELAERFGLPGNVLVSSGGGDNMMAAIGTGNVAPGVITASLGTSGTIFACSDKPVVDERGELAAFCSSSGMWLPLVCTMNVTVATELTRDLFSMNLEQFNDMASRAPAGSEGVVLVPYFNGERTPALPTATATLAGLSSVNYTRENICRAAIEGATLGLRYGLDVMVRQGVAPSEVRLVGGGSKSALWRQAAADIFGCPVVCPTTPEAGALGAAIQAAWCRSTHDGEGAGIKDLTDKYVCVDDSTRVEPDAAAVEEYEGVYERYLAVSAAMAAI